jgi:serine/threonine-protein kinase
MLARAYPSGNGPPEVLQALATSWDVAARANGLEGEIASHTRRLEALERRGRALRAEIGRKVEELAQEESRALRDAQTHAEEEEAARGELTAAEKQAQESASRANEADRAGKGSRQVYEQTGAATAMVEVKRQQLKQREAKRAAREAIAKDLRRQIEELRAQLARYAEALEEDLASGREKVAARTREGLKFEESFQKATTTLISHLKGKPECRELMNEILPNGEGGAPAEPKKEGSGQVPAA